MKRRVLHYAVLSDASISAEKGQQHHYKKHSKDKEFKGHVTCYNLRLTDDKQKNNVVCQPGLMNSEEITARSQS